VVIVVHGTASFHGRFVCGVVALRAPSEPFVLSVRSFDKLSQNGGGVHRALRQAQRERSGFWFGSS
jgi:hypothetical protein